MNDSNSKIIVLAVVLALSWTSGNAAENESRVNYAKTMSLSNNYVLKIYESDDMVLTIGLYHDKNLIKSIVIENSTTDDGSIVPTHFDANGGNYYFITANDRSSTYGATTTVVVWESGVNWKTISTPFVHGYIEDRDKDGIFEIIEDYSHKRVFKFDDGLFVEDNPSKV